MSWISKDLSYYFEVPFKSLFMLNVIAGFFFIVMKNKGGKEMTDVLQN